MAKRISMKKHVITAIILAGCLMFASAGAFAAVDWPTFGMDRERTGNNPSETVLNATNVNLGLKQHWATQLNGAILTQPTLAAGVKVNGVPTDVVYAATMAGTMYALNAATGAIIWQQSVPPATTPRCPGLFQGVIGFMGTPTIERSTNRLYIVSGRGYLHAYDLATGADTPGFNLPIIDAANFWPRTFVYGGLNLIGSSLYIATAGDPCDDQPYHGQVMQVRTTAPPAVVGRWYPNGPNGPDGGGIWGAGGVSIPPDGSVEYALTGNAFANPENFGFSEHVVKLSPALAVAASNSPVPPTPSGPDSDFGATATLFQAAGTPVTMLAAYNKNGNLYIYSRATIQQHGPIATFTIAQPSSDGSNIGLPAFDPILNQLYIISPSDSPNGIFKHGVIALAVAPSGAISLKWQTQVGNNTPVFNPAISPIIANGVVYYASVSNTVYALRATDGVVLWSTSITPVRSGEGNFASPMVVNGQLFVAGSDHALHAYGL
jgi:outer membrane protein assembly factor BamB